VATRVGVYVTKADEGIVWSRRATGLASEDVISLARVGDEVWCLAGDRVYVGNVGGRMTVLRAGRRRELLAQIEMDAPLYSRPALIGDALLLASAQRLYLITAKP